MIPTPLRRKRQQALSPSPGRTPSLCQRLAHDGPATFSLSELTAVITESAPETVSCIARDYGEQSLCGLRNAKQASDAFGIPFNKACQLVAACELGRRFSSRPRGRSAVLRSAKDVSKYVAEMHDLPKEYLRGIYLDGRHKIVCDEVISVGTTEACFADPKQIFAPALQFGAVAVILVHNHPSGDVTASPADIELTLQLVAAGRLMNVNIVEHVIVGRGKFRSIPANYDSDVRGIPQTA